ncbi:MAG: hypothetical protein R2857_06720 [Vampirovibrionales bacterium]
MPAAAPVGSLLPTDWKTYAQIASGVVAVRSFNSALDVQPPAWLTAVETSALLHPMTLGIKGHALRHLPVMAAYVGSVVGVTNWAVNAFDDHVGRDNHIPRWVPKLVLWATAVLGGAKLYPALTRRMAQSGLLGEALSVKPKRQRVCAIGSWRRGGCRNDVCQRLLPNGNLCRGGGMRWDRCSRATWPRMPMNANGPMSGNGNRPSCLPCKNVFKPFGRLLRDAGFSGESCAHDAVAITRTVWPWWSWSSGRWRPFSSASPAPSATRS